MTAENVHCCLVVATVNVLLLLRAGEILLPLKRLRRRCNRSLFSKQLMRINACANLLLSTYTEMHKFATYTHSCQKLIDLKQKSSTESDHARPQLNSKMAQVLSKLAFIKENNQNVTSWVNPSTAKRWVATVALQLFGGCLLPLQFLCDWKWSLQLVTVNHQKNISGMFVSRV